MDAKNQLAQSAFDFSEESAFREKLLFEALCALIRPAKQPVGDDALSFVQAAGIPARPKKGDKNQPL